MYTAIVSLGEGMLRDDLRLWAFAGYPMNWDRNQNTYFRPIQQKTSIYSPVVKQSNWTSQTEVLAGKSSN